MTDTADTTIAELVQFIDRAKMALTEAGRPELAERAHVIVTDDGNVRLSFRYQGDITSDPDVLKFLDIDPVFCADVPAGLVPPPGSTTGDDQP